MTIPTRESYSQGCVIDRRSSFDEGGSPLDEYLVKSTAKLDLITELVNNGEFVNLDSHKWMLDQVDFIVETIGTDGLELSEDLRSNLLQFLLAIANLNEQIRRHASLHL